MDKFIYLFLLCSMSLYSQIEKVSIKGTIYNSVGNTIPAAFITIENSNIAVYANQYGKYIIQDIPLGKITLTVSADKYETVTQIINLESGSKDSIINIKLDDESLHLNNIIVSSKNTQEIIEEKGFEVNAIETKHIKNQNFDLNQVLNSTSGVKVRTTAGVGSEFEYSLDGMSGNAIRYFIDGIPIDLYGKSYAINNIPISIIERIDLYKGVVPIEIGSDALGGAINLVTNKSNANYVESNYSIGSYNTHKAAFHGQWRSKKGLTTKLSTFYTYSDNDYKVWGESVFYADESKGYQIVNFTKDKPTKRFNDDFETYSAKVDIGFTQKKWTDQLFFTLLGSKTNKGVQTAQTMSRVYGKVRNNEKTWMPSIIYKKNNFFIKGLNVNTFIGLSKTKAMVIDTSFLQYDWRGKVIGSRASGGEMGYDGRSLFTLMDNTRIIRTNTTYNITSRYKLGFNYIYSRLDRSGKDKYSPTYRIPYLKQQNVGYHFAGLALESNHFHKKVQTNLFVKYHLYEASINELIFTTAFEVIKKKFSIPNWGFGFAFSYRLSPLILFKASLEQYATRLPSPLEALGNGVNIASNPYIKPENNFNINIGTILGKFDIGDSQSLKVGTNVFYRKAKNRMQLVVEDARGFGKYKNIGQISGLGGEMDLTYKYNQYLKLNLNGTYLNYRNDLKVDEDGRDNIFFKDRIPNEPYLLLNGEISYNTNHVFQENSKLFSYFQTSYVHEFYLTWESAAAIENKRTIPSQFVVYTGLGYTFPSEHWTVALDVSNLLNEQVYDNYRLQNPGRAIYFKVNYIIKY